MAAGHDPGARRRRRWSCRSRPRSSSTSTTGRLTAGHRGAPVGPARRQPSRPADAEDRHRPPAPAGQRRPVGRRGGARPARHGLRRVRRAPARAATWLAGDAFTVADCAAAPALFYCRAVHPWSDHAELVALLPRDASRDRRSRAWSTEARPYRPLFPPGFRRRLRRLNAGNAAPPGRRHLRCHRQTRREDLSRCGTRARWRPRPRRASLAVRPWTCRCSSPAPPAPCPRRGAACPRSCCAPGGERILLDCGEGTQHQLLRSVGLPDVDAIFITHLHLDHWLGLPGMIKTFDMRDRDRRAGRLRPARPERAVPAGAAPDHRAHGVSAGRGRARAPRGGRLRRLRDRRRSRSTTASRPTATRSSRTTGPGRFDVEAARALGVTEGPDFGRLQRGETVNGVTPEQVVGEDRPGRRIVYTGDTAPVQSVEVYAARRRRARPRGDVLRGRARPRARDGPLDRPPGRADGPRRQA